MFMNNMGSVFKHSVLIIALAFAGSAVASVSTTPNELAYFNKQKHNIAEASDKTGVSMELLTAVGSKESGLGRAKLNRSSGTRGVMHFKPSTWRAELKRHHRSLGLSAKADVMNDRANILVSAAALAENKHILTQKLGYVPTNGDVYMTHLMGFNGALKVLKGKPNAPISRYVKLYRGNYSLTHTRGGRVMTVREFRQAMNQLIKKESARYQLALNQARLDYVMAQLATTQTSSFLTRS